MITIDNVKKFSLLRKDLAKKFNTTEKTVQRAIDALFDFARKNTGGIITPSMLIMSAEPETSILHDVFDWENENNRIKQASDLLDNIPVFISSDGRMYRVTKQ
jgi:hypothetical protein